MIKVSGEGIAYIPEGLTQWSRFVFSQMQVPSTYLLNEVCDFFPIKCLQQFLKKESQSRTHSGPTTKNLSKIQILCTKKFKEFEAAHFEILRIKVLNGAVESHKPYEGGSGGIELLSRY